jgi:hypothetical protein
MEGSSRHVVDMLFLNLSEMTEETQESAQSG